MANTFDTVLQRITYDATKAPRAPGQRVAIVDPKSGEVFMDTLPLLKRHKAGSFRYYLVSPERQADCPRKEATIADFSGRRRAIEFIITVIGIDRDRIAETVSALAKDSTPFDSLVVDVTRWLQEFVDQKHAAKVYPLVRLSEPLKDECAKFISEKALAQLGLRISCTLRLPEEDLKLPPFDLKMKVMVKDVEDELDARVEVKIEPPATPEERSAALDHLVPSDELREQIELRTKQWFREHCSLEMFCYAATSVRDSLQQDLRKYIENELKLRLFSLRVTCGPKFDFPTQFPPEIDLTVESTIEPSQTKIQVHHKLLLKRDNIAVLRNSGVTDLRARINELLELHTRAVFFAKKYVEVVVGFETLREEIKTKVSTDVISLGFAATQLITIPNEEQMQRVLEGSFPFDTLLPNKHTDDGKTADAGGKEKPVCTFSTKDSRVNFGLSIQARVRLKNLDRVKSFLHPKTDLRDNFKQAAREAAAEVIRTLSPQQLYIEFSGNPSPSGDGASPPQPPEARIKQAVTDRLDKSFNAEVENITLTTETTDLTQLYGAIRPAGSHHFDLVFQTLGSTGERFVFHVDYRILGITTDGWPTFQEINNNTRASDVGSRANEIVQALNQFLISATTARLQLMPPDLLRSAHFSVVEGVGNIFDEAVEGVRRHFGLEIEIVGKPRELTGWETKEQEMALEAHKSLTRQLRALESKYEELQAGLPPDDPVLKELSEKIEGCRARLKEFAPDHNEHFSQIKTALRQLPTIGLDRYLLPPKQVAKDEGGAGKEA